MAEEKGNFRSYMETVKKKDGNHKAKKYKI